MVVEALGPQTLDLIKTRGRSSRFKKGTAVFRRGDPGGSMLFINAGKAEISITSAAGQKSILGLAGPGDIVGDIACLDGGPRSADVIAVEPVEAIEVLRRDMLQILRSDNDSAILLIEALCQKARNASEMFEVQALASGKSRLASCVLRLLEDDADASEPARIRVSQSWLGSYAGLTRENVNRQLRGWNEKNITRIENGEIVVLDQDALLDIAMSDD